MGYRPDGKPIRIAIYLHDMSGGGAERMRINLMQNLREAGAHVDLVLHSRRGELLGRVPAGVSVTGFETRRTVSDLWPLRNYLRRTRPDILLSSLNHNNIIAALANRLAGRRTRLIVTQHNALSQEAVLSGGWKYRIMPRAYRLVSSLVDGIVAVSAGVAQDMAAATGIALRNITVIYNPVVDTELVVRADEPCDHAWFAPGEPPVFITAGRIVVQKDHAMLLHAFALARKARPGRLMILGGGPLLEQSRALAAELGVADDVAFLGFQPNPLPFYRRAAAFVLSSRYEGFGNVLVEALACGLPVVSTDCPHGPAEILDGGRFGVLVPVGDAAALACAMSPDLRTRFPAAGLQQRAREFTSETAAARYLKLVRAVLGYA